MAQQQDTARYAFIGDGLVGIGLTKNEEPQRVAIVFDLLERPARVGEDLGPQTYDGERRLFGIVAKNTAALDALAEVVRRAREEMAAMEEGR